MQTILGAGGDIGTHLAKALKSYTGKIRLVARQPRKVNDMDELFSADLTKKEEVFKAVAGSEIVYLTVGLKYDIKTWRAQWPMVMENVINACMAHHAKLVFFDNVYMYDKGAIPHMTEESAINPPSEKGKIRAQLFSTLMGAIKQRGLVALVARSADFYGPNSKNGVLNIAVINNYKKGKSAFWQSDPNKIHSMTFTPDAAKATALLGNTPDAYGQVWHLPTSAEKLTGKDYVALTADAMNVKPRSYVLSKLMIGLMGLFNGTVRELKEMQYQNDRDYFFDSGKIEKRFGLKPTPYKEGIRLSVAG